MKEPINVLNTVHNSNLYPLRKVQMSFDGIRETLLTTNHMKQSTHVYMSGELMFKGVRPKQLAYPMLMNKAILCSNFELWNEHQQKEFNMYNWAIDPFEEYGIYMLYENIELKQAYIITPNIRALFI